MNPSNQTIWEQTLLTLTAQAGQAAELGRWDKVEACFRLRGQQLRDHSIAPPLAADLAALDREVEARIMNARLAVQSQLVETAKIRRRFLGLRSWQGRSEIQRPLITKVG